MFGIIVCLLYFLIVQEILWHFLNDCGHVPVRHWCYSLFWPIPLAWFVVKIVWVMLKLLLAAVHELLALLLMILTIKYRRTKVYRTIDNLLTR